VVETIYYRTFTICADSHSTKLLAHPNPKAYERSGPQISIHCQVTFIAKRFGSAFHESYASTIVAITPQFPGRMSL
jgi:hypothetical protein